MSFYHDIGHYPSFLKHNPIAHVNNQSAECRVFLWAPVFLKKTDFHITEKSSKGIIDLTYHFVKYRKFVNFPGVYISWKCTISAEFWVNRLKLCESYALPKTFSTTKLAEITIFHTVYLSFAWNVNFIEKLISAYDTTKSKCSEAAEAMRSVMSLIHWKSKRKTITAKIP